MRITNVSDRVSTCKINNRVHIIQRGESLEIERIGEMIIAHDYESCYCNSVGSSKVLKILEIFDDPFHYKKKYNIVVSASYDGLEKYNAEDLIISHDSYYASVELGTYYDFFTLRCKDEVIVPKKLSPVGDEQLLSEFNKYNKKAQKWNAVWEILIEPLFLEIIGFFLIYVLCSMWFGQTAVYIVVALIALTILLEALIYKLTTKNKKNVKAFKQLLAEKEIHKYYGELLKAGKQR